MIFFLISTLLATPFQIPQIQQLLNSISTACQIYAPETSIGKHIRAVFPSSQYLPPLTSYASQASGLFSALRKDSFASMEEFNAFIANILWESICLSTKEESCGSSCPDAPFQGRGYIQITGRANYQEFANFVGNQAIMTNPALVATEESLSWESAIFFWARNCKGITSVGAGTMCVNSPECSASSTSSTRYFQFAPFYRLFLGQSLGLGSDTTFDSMTACSQMNIGLDQSWIDFCNFHGNDKSVNCPYAFGSANTVVGSAPGPIPERTNSSVLSASSSFTSPTESQTKPVKETQHPTLDPNSTPSPTSSGTNLANHFLSLALWILTQ
jgi:hypothetical protein